MEAATADSALAEDRWPPQHTAHGDWVIDVEELWDVATQKVPEFVAELRPWLDAGS